MRVQKTFTGENCPFRALPGKRSRVLTQSDDISLTGKGCNRGISFPLGRSCEELLLTAMESKMNTVVTGIAGFIVFDILSYLK